MQVYALNTNKKQRLSFDPLKIKVVVEKNPINALGGIWLNDPILFKELSDSDVEITEYQSIDHLIQAQVEHSSMSEPTIHSLLDKMSEITQSSVDALKNKKIEALPQLKTSIEKLSQDVKPLADKLKEFAVSHTEILKDGVSTVKDLFKKETKTEQPHSDLDLSDIVPNKPTEKQSTEKPTAKQEVSHLSEKYSFDSQNNHLSLSVGNETETIKVSRPFESLLTATYRSVLLDKELSFKAIKDYSDQYTAMSYLVEENQLLLIGNGEKLIKNVPLTATNTVSFVDIVSAINNNQKIDVLLTQLQQTTA